MPSVPPETTARSALLRGATLVFSEKGFFSTRITDITRAAGVSAGSFYTYFDSKEEILCAVMDSIHTAEAPDISVSPATTAEEAAQWLRRGLQLAVDGFVENSLMWRAVQQAALGRVPVRGRVRDRQDAIVAAVATAIAPLVDNGLARPSTPVEFVARALVAMTEESLVQWFLLQDAPIDRDEAVERLFWAWARLLRFEPARTVARG